MSYLAIAVIAKLLTNPAIRYIIYSYEKEN